MSLAPYSPLVYPYGMMTNLTELTKEVRILELLEQKRQLKAKCARLDEYDDLVDVNAALVEALKAAPALPMKSNIDFWYGIYDAWRDKALALVEGE